MKIRLGAKAPQQFSSFLQSLNDFPGTLVPGVLLIRILIYYLGQEVSQTNLKCMTASGFLIARVLTRGNYRSKQFSSVLEHATRLIAFVFRACRGAAAFATPLRPLRGCEETPCSSHLYSELAEEPLRALLLCGRCEKQFALRETIRPSGNFSSLSFIFL